MPKPLKWELIKYLFEDVFHQFRGFLHIKDYPDSEFYYHLAFLFLPRKYEKGEKILSQGDEVHEIILITSGELKVGFKYLKT